MARCLLKSKNVPGEFWGEAVTTTVYLLNRAPTKSLQCRTPHEAWYNKKPRVDHLRTFGSVVHVKKAGPGVNKLSDRSTPMVLMGYEAEGQKAIVCMTLWPRNSTYLVMSSFRRIELGIGSKKSNQTERH
jgi:hypothetical protein